MIITWTTLSFVNDSVVEYGINGLDTKASGNVRSFKNGGKTNREETIHEVLLNGLIPGQQYSN